ncbi:hypothetical protein EJ05DRAFT_34898 [Pseudovirgaria hyperparasitica]|uniref:Pre-mRNA-splicing factor CWC24 n=1 Tax=Pseudovirgaria hyperparasitica TaxID=470096 RepID=A0A6A6WMC1_9PEZI|nr:uncharacterized protein EJ05DRAFT_34898 [Pseudovirgaria hyperparasitica]KAF2763351.1 hypothetical protein EJ05DRAFT_34898 [Pseudovirgaria hyperparasitica]
MSSDTAAVELNTSVTFKKRGARTNARKRPASPVEIAQTTIDDADSGDDLRIKRHKVGKNLISSTTSDTKVHSIFTEGTSNFKSERTSAITANNDATKHSDWYEDDGFRNPNHKNITSSTSSGTKTTDANPNPLVPSHTKAPAKFAGPIKAAKNVRTIIITDFAPDVCKDYKKTGFCGFGDSCKYLHQRENYAAGHTLDADWDKKTKEEREGGTIVASANRRLLETTNCKESVEDPEVKASKEPCRICNGPYREPVRTKCGHYFCLKCANPAPNVTGMCPHHGDKPLKIESSFTFAKKLAKLVAKREYPV